ncbi:MAG: endonuclease III domain-containing protein [Candidatus Omnitrophota bacterium]
MNKKPLSIFKKLHAYFGPQGWWPADSAFEVIIGSILTQNTNWNNVSRAIANLKRDGLLNAERLLRLPRRRLASLIKPAGYYNIKAARIKNFLDFFKSRYTLRLKNMSLEKTGRLREELLSVNGIGNETADSILLYALEKPVFVVDAYTKRIFSRHKLIRDDASYGQIQKFFMQNLKKDVELFNEYHALIVKLGKEFCCKAKPKCDICPLK